MKRLLFALALITVFSVTATDAPVIAANGEYAVVLSSGILNAADHELDAGGVGYFNVGVGQEPASVILKVNTPGWLHLKQRLGQPGRLVWMAE